jgi:hypothetical protein
MAETSPEKAFVCRIPYLLGMIFILLLALFYPPILTWVPSLLKG